MADSKRTASLIFYSIFSAYLGEKEDYFSLSTAALLM
jgi:hypothetical protein